MECCSKTDFGIISGRGEMGPKCSKTSFPGTRNPVKMVKILKILNILNILFVK